MKTLSPAQFRITLLFIFVLTLVLFSCKKETENDLNYGPVKLAVKLEGIETDHSEINEGKVAGTKIQSSTTPEVLEIPINNGLSAYVTLTEDQNNEDSTFINNEKIAAKQTASLEPGVLYGILVYLGDNLIDHKIFSAGQEANTSAFELDGGKTYTFLGYSRNSSANIPTVTNPNNLSTATILNETGDLLYYKHTQKVSTGNNTLKVTLRHKFTLVTTEIKVGTTYNGVIKQVGNGAFAKTKQSASCKLADSTITYSPTEKTSTISFPTSIPSSGLASVKSTPNLLIADNSTNVVTYSFPSITVNDIAGTIPQTAFNMQAGKKYNLIITLDVPCIKNSTTFSSNDGKSVTHNNINGSNGYVLNINHLDDSFNLKINGTNLFEMKCEQGVRNGTQTTNGIFKRTFTKTLTTNNSTRPTSTQFDNAPENISEWEEDGTVYWKNGPVISYAWTDWEAADLAFEYGANGHMGYANALINGSTTSWTTYNINSGLSNPTTPAVRVNISSDGVVSIQAKRTTSGNLESGITISTTGTLRNNPSTTLNTDYPSKYFYKDYPTETYSINPNGAAITTTYEMVNNGNGTYTHKRIQTQKTVSSSTHTRTIKETIVRNVQFRQNTITWNKNGNNTVVIGQRVIGYTSMDGNITARFKVNCATNQ